MHYKLIASNNENGHVTRTVVCVEYIFCAQFPAQAWMSDNRDINMDYTVMIQIWAIFLDR